MTLPPIWGENDFFVPPKTGCFQKFWGENMGGKYGGKIGRLGGKFWCFPPKIQLFRKGVFPPLWGENIFPPPKWGENFCETKVSPPKSVFPQEFLFSPHNFEDIFPPSDDFGGKTPIYFPLNVGGKYSFSPQNGGILKSWGENLSTSELCGGKIFRMGGKLLDIFPPG